MSILAELKSRFVAVLSQYDDNPTELVEMIRPAQDARFGDYQANFAMPLGKRVGKPPREIAAEIVEKVDVSDLCESPEIAGPGFINLRVKDDQLIAKATAAVANDRIGVPTVSAPRTYLIDYSSPNVAKPMHVGHIRSTVIGDSLCRLLRFLGHNVISDNHLGDWGTQFGMIIYGYRNFIDQAAYEAQPVQELTRVYRVVRKIMDVLESKAKLPKLEELVAEKEGIVKEKEAAPKTGDKKKDKRAAKDLRKAQGQQGEARFELAKLTEKVAGFTADAELTEQVDAHADIANAVLQETAKLHVGDDANLELWNQFLPKCRDEIDRVYKRLDIEFDFELGESFYHDRLAPVVEDLQQRGLAKESDGAMCVFLEEYDAPMIVQKKDGAFLYATTDLATIAYRMENWKPDAILYVVDHRQSDHFGKLFAVAKLSGCEDVELKHVSFGTVLGDDGKPFQTRSGDTVGLEGLLDEAVGRARKVVDENSGDLPEEQRSRVADVVGHAAIKYADLSHNRESDYTFSYDKMLALTGNTATYLQYAYARVRNIFSRGEIDIDALRGKDIALTLAQPAERALALSLLRFEESLEFAAADYRPNHLTSYLFDLAAHYSAFYNDCHVLKAETEELKQSRLLLCDLTARTVRQGLALLGINVVEQM